MMDKNSAEIENCQIDFETVHNIDEWGSDFVPTMREALKCWNMTVQHWLVFVVYKRFPYKVQVPLHCTDFQSRKEYL